jgi:two-component system chemotaxis sensor kinase CheA
MTLRVPLTLTIIPALTVSIGSQHFAIPRSAIEEIVRANGGSVTLERIGGAGVATIRGRRVPEVALADILGLPSQVGDEERTLVVLRPAGGDVYALAVDRIHDEELVVKPAAPAVWRPASMPARLWQTMAARSSVRPGRSGQVGGVGWRL